MARSQETANPEDDDGFGVPDNCYYVFEDLISFPCDTALTVAQVKQQLVNKLVPLFPKLGLDGIDQR